MSRTCIGAGKKVVAFVNSLESGSKDKPWLVIMSCDVADLPIEAHATKRTATGSAKRWMELEDERYEAVCKNIRKRAKRKPLPPRELFHTYYVKRYDEKP